jgi:hypothetical protein
VRAVKANLAFNLCGIGSRFFIMETIAVCWFGMLNAFKSPERVQMPV